MQHGVKSTFEIVGETQVVDGQTLNPPGIGFRFGRIFQNLPPFRPTDASLKSLGAFMVKDTPRPDSVIPAGYTYFGQFVDHDMTLDDTKGNPDSIPVQDNADLIKQLRSPSLDLDSLYGKPDTFDPDLMPDGLHFKLGVSSKVDLSPPFGGPPSDQDFPGGDVHRIKGVAQIGDPRNDENLIIQQIHLAFLKFHNKTADILREAQPDASDASLFAQARDLVTRHYQWLVLQDFVRRLVSPQMFSAVLGVPTLDGAASVTPNPLVFKISAFQTPPMPLEFSAAAYRLGHSMIRPNYSWNRFFNAPTTDFRFFFQFTNLSGTIGKGGPPTFPSNWLADWRRMFEMETVTGFPTFARGNGPNQIPLNFAKSIDTHLAPVLGTLPNNDGSLADRNLIRGSRNGLPSGQDVAAAIVAAGDKTAKPLSPTAITQGLPSDMAKKVAALEFHSKTPLWFYILKEAENGGGNHLGPVGSRIVLETFLALIRASIISIFRSDVSQPNELLVFDPDNDSPLRTPGGEAIKSLPHLLAFVGDVNLLGD